MTVASSLRLSPWFEHLRAEDEPWLEQVFLPPAIFDQISIRKSIVITGESGSGKTALRLAIARRVLQHEPNSLLVEWFPEPPDEEMDVSRLAVFAKHQAMSAIAEALLHKLGQDPALLQDAPGFALDGLAFFLQSYLPIDPHYQILMIAGECNPAALPGVQSLLDRPEQVVVRDVKSYDSVMKALLGALAVLHIPGVWVLVDGLERWSQGLEQRLTAMLAAMLDTLSFFEKTGITFKIFVPKHLNNSYTETAGVKRRRVDTLDLIWKVEDLDILVTRRAAAAGLGIDTFLGIAQDEKFKDLFSSVAGTTPRKWLDQAQPFLQALSAYPPGARLPEMTWRQIAASSPPRLRFDPSIRQVYLGGVEIELTAASLSILEYLYANRGRYCSRDEIYYRAMRGLEYVPEKKPPLERQDPNFEHRSTWNTRFDNAISRLRKQIEPLPAAPVYVVTHRRNGLRLENAG